MKGKATQEIKFGTDGWRGVIADNFTFKNVAIVSGVNFIKGNSNWPLKNSSNPGDTRNLRQIP